MKNRGACLQELRSSCLLVPDAADREEGIEVVQVPRRYDGRDEVATVHMLERLLNETEPRQTAYPVKDPQIAGWILHL